MPRGRTARPLAESSLRGIIREFLLLEAARSVEDFIASGGSVRIGGYTGGSSQMAVELFLTDEETGNLDRVGMISCGPPAKTTRAYGGPCRPVGRGGEALPRAWEVKWSQAEDGHGPLLYDIAMETARIFGASLASDRDEVSYEAQRVWSFYDRNRSDVVKGQLDDEDGTLTPDDEEDDCSQWMSKSVAQDAGAPDEWDQEPLSRAFTVPEGQYPRLRALAAADRLRAPPAVISALGG